MQEALLLLLLAPQEVLSLEQSDATSQGDAQSPGVLLGAGGDLLAPASLGETEAEGACTSLGKQLPKVPISACFTPWISGHSAGT